MAAEVKECTVKSYLLTVECCNEEFVFRVERDRIIGGRANVELILKEGEKCIMPFAVYKAVIDYLFCMDSDPEFDTLSLIISEDITYSIYKCGYGGIDDQLLEIPIILTGRKK